ncbi:MAG: YHYH protein [Actinomycetia bacterium]|nr:YHYH protein [Actinomycetes bacterium]
MQKLPLVAGLALLLVGCGNDTNSESPVVVATTAVEAATTVADAPSGDESVGSDASDGSIVNSWVGPAADLTALPIGTSLVSTAGPAVGGLYVCDGGNPNGGGAFAVGPWIDEAAGTWDLTAKVTVSGEISWPTAEYSETIDGTNRLISSNGLPVDTITGVFPIAADDAAYSYDRNPNSISESAISITLPLTPVAADAPSCLPKGTIAVFKNGVAGFASVDALNRDAVAYETQDDCDGHPEVSSTYHYHNIPVCLLDATVGSSTVVGFAYDGFPIVVERDAAGDLPTNADLDECHGRTSPINLDGAVVEMYHYSATYEFPYFIGCYHGTAI